MGLSTGVSGHLLPYPFILYVERALVTLEGAIYLLVHTMSLSSFHVSMSNRVRMVQAWMHS